MTFPTSFLYEWAMNYKLIPILALLSCHPTPPTHRSPLISQIIHGRDHRQEPQQVPIYWQDKSRSVAAQIHSHFLSLQGDVYQINTAHNWESSQYCQDEKFYGQPLAARCSGFLIAPTLILTAGHCLPSCPHFLWVFDYRMDSSPLSIPKENVYSCNHSEIIPPSTESEEGFGLVHLDRPVSSHRKPLALRKKGRIKNHERVILVGYPLGLPLKIDSGENHRGNSLRHNSHPSYFMANLDSFAGNSGSPVLNARTGLVEGLAIGGEEDFLYNFEENCYQSKYCSSGTCQGENILRITSLPHDRYPHKSPQP